MQSSQWRRRSSISGRRLSFLGKRCLSKDGITALGTTAEPISEVSPLARRLHRSSAGACGRDAGRSCRGRRLRQLVEGPQGHGRGCASIVGGYQRRGCRGRLGIREYALVQYGARDRQERRTQGASCSLGASPYSRSRSRRGRRASFPE